MNQLARNTCLMLFLASLCFSVALAGCGGEERDVNGARVVRVAIQPVYSLTVMSQRYQPLIEYLREETGYHVEQVSPLSQTNYLSTIEGAQVDVAFLNPLLYIQVAKTRGAYPLARAVNPDGNDQYRGVIITRADSGIRSLQDLRGRIVMTSSKKGVGGYLGQCKLLKENGIDPDRDLTIVLARTQDEVARAVFRGKAKAGFVREDFVSALGTTIEPRQFRIIAYTDYFPTWCFVAFKHTDLAVAQAVRQAILILDPQDANHRLILEQAEVARFIETSDSDYDIVRKVIADLDLPY